MNISINKHYYFMFDPSEQFDSLNGIYKVVRALMYTDMVDEGVDLYASLYAIVGKTKNDYETTVSSYLGGVFYNLLNVETNTYIWVPESLIVGYPDSNVKEYPRVMITTDLGIIEDPEGMLAVKDLISLIIKSKVGTDIPSNHLTTNFELLSVDDYPELAIIFGTIFGGDGVTDFRLPNAPMTSKHLACDGTIYDKQFLDSLDPNLSGYLADTFGGDGVTTIGMPSILDVVTGEPLLLDGTQQLDASSDVSPASTSYQELYDAIGNNYDTTDPVGEDNTSFGLPSIVLTNETELAFDGSIHNIDDYPSIGNILKDHAATYNGDGVTTFGMPTVFRKESIANKLDPITSINVYGKKWMTQRDYDTLVATRGANRAVNDFEIVDYHALYVEGLSTISNLSSRIAAQNEIILELLT